jgi:hypothetical protein
MIVTYSECVLVALGTQHAMHMCRHIVICGLSISILSYKRHDFKKKDLQNSGKCQKHIVLWVSVEQIVFK